MIEEFLAWVSESLFKISPFRYLMVSKIEKLQYEVLAM